MMPQDVLAAKASGRLLLSERSVKWNLVRFQLAWQ